MNELIKMLRICGDRCGADCPEIEECPGPGYLMLKAAEALEKLSGGVDDGVGNKA